MARPTKEGLDYFPLDVDVFEDEKIEAIAGEFGLKGEIAVIKLLCAIYKKGYFILWNDLTQATLLKRLPGVSKEMLNQIVNRLVIWGFFDKKLFDSVEVLTSENIQATYFEATKRRKSPKPTKYVINVNNNTQDERDNADINPQSKGNKSKGNKSKGNETRVSSSRSNVDLNPECARSFWLNQVNPAEAPMILESIDYWVNDFDGQELIVIEAIKEMLRNNAKSYNYLDKILKNWESLGLNTPEKVANYLQGKYFRNPKNRHQKLEYENLDEYADL